MCIGLRTWSISGFSFTATKDTDTESESDSEIESESESDSEIESESDDESSQSEDSAITSKGEEYEDNRKKKYAKSGNNGDVRQLHLS